MPVFSVDASKVTISRVVVYRHSGIRTVGPFKGLSETMTGDVDVLEGHRGRRVTEVSGCTDGSML